MGTKLIKNRLRGANLKKKLTDQQRMFVLELLASDSFSPKEAARKAGYKMPGQASYKLLKQPKIAAALGKAQREREERCELKGDDVLNYLRIALFYNPLEHFYPTDDGKWSIRDISELPEEIGRLIDKVEVRVVETEQGTVSTLVVELISKATVLTLAMKHIGVERSEVKHVVAWDSLYIEDNKSSLDGIEARILEGESSVVQGGKI